MKDSTPFEGFPLLVKNFHLLVKDCHLLVKDCHLLVKDSTFLLRSVCCDVIFVELWSSGKRGHER